MPSVNAHFAMSSGVIVMFWISMNSGFAPAGL